MESVNVKVGKRWYPLTMREGSYGGQKHIIYESPSRNVREQVIKGMSKRVWRGGKPESWPNDSMFFSAPDCDRNRWHLSFFMGEDPYAKYKAPEISFPFKPRFSKTKNKELAPFPHQQAMADHWISRKQCHLAAEMRTGKTLPALSVAEYLRVPTWIIAPRSAIAGIELEIWNWGFPQFYLMTYERLKKVLSEWEEGRKPPQCVIFDEFSKAKNWGVGNTQACFHLTTAMREEFEEPYILGMTGTPAPLDPTDWWSQIEIIQPGYIKENHPKDLKRRLAILEKTESETGGHFDRVVRWKDTEGLCDICGETEHLPIQHPFVPMKNEVLAFSERLQGMTKVFFKKDCMNLPEKEFIRLRLPVDQKALKYAKLVKKQTTNGALALVRLRQISSGFIYKNVAGDKELPCTKCDGTGTQLRNIGGGKKEPTKCPSCEDGIVRNVVRETSRIGCPKDQAFRDLLEEHEEVGRFVAYGSFKGCIDRMVELALKDKWKVIRVDGRGWETFGLPINRDSEALSYFAGGQDRVVFIGHPKSGGMGISLSASPTIMFWDNSFNAEDRLQAVERGTDANMDLNKGCRIIDLVHLPTDELVLDKLDKKANLQKITMGEINDGIPESDL